MLWSDVRKAYPNQWLVIEAIKAHTTPNNRRKLDKIAVIDVCVDGNAAINSYRQLHSQFPTREFYFVHTSREELDIRERQWVGIRRDNGILGMDFLTEAGAVLNLREMKMYFVK